MIYERIQKGRFLKRPNRFIAKIEINGKEETVHVKNTGRCAELLAPGAEAIKATVKEKMELFGSVDKA